MFRDSDTPFADHALDPLGLEVSPEVSDDDEENTLDDIVGWIPGASW